MNEENEQEAKTLIQRVLRLVAQWFVVGIVLFVVITGAYISLAAYTGQSVQFTGYESLQTPAILTGIILIIFGFAYILYSSGPSKDGAWTIMTDPFFR
jgi:hypothetical protein